jgi:hypothetical protein
MFELSSPLEGAAVEAAPFPGVLGGTGGTGDGDA